ncbi:hypothetical protein ABL78_7948 [Leptomonas seymouri]|uniref:PDZ domain-containing protein n=1 Tax=Leptomonas seymouri TaxID=5684 RepID=A0A0N1I193_LEPSE|nr:hypothetical protein ABL78_7948 [Leptomonas seymouri]|eukprot:KPI83030.1 hypothetical protein ABL78_7948 [Leptomonas seymouri]
MQERKEHINIIYPEEGKRYRLNIRTSVGRLTIAKVKQCLATASSCPIQREDMVLYLNGVPLSNDRDLCESLGIGNGATLSVEARAPPRQLEEQQLTSHQSREGTHREGGAANALEGESGVHRSRSAGGTSPFLPPSPPLILSEQRRLLELQTLAQQDEMLLKDGVVRDDMLKSTLLHADDEINEASLRRRQLERWHDDAEEELRHIREKEAAAAQERQRIATLRSQEAARAAERVAQLAERREQLRAEQEAERAIVLLKLENEKKKAMLAQQKALLAAEKERAQLEQASFEMATKARELELRSREIDMEHQRLARIREARDLEADRRLSVKQRLHYYHRLGVEPPRALQREAASLLLSGSEDDEGEDGNERTQHRMELLEGRSSEAVERRATSAKTSGDGSEDRLGLVQHRATSTSSCRDQRHSQPLKRLSSTQPDSSPSIPRNVHASATLAVPEGGYYNARENAEANLRRLGDDLGLPESLQFDDSDTCVISIDGEYTLLVTYDAATERLYLYSTLLAALPSFVLSAPEARVKLYEFLLEASLLGREMCGGGIGASMRNNFILMSASLYMPTSQPWSLRSVVPQFLHCLQYWRAKLNAFLEALQQEGLGAGATTPAAAGSGVTPVSHQASPSASPYVATATPPSWSPAQQQQRAAAAAQDSVHSLSQGRSQAASHSPSHTPLPNAANEAKVIPVLGLEVTGTVLLNGIPTHYASGVLVVNAAGPSLLAGIQPNDFVEELNHVPIRSVHDFRRVIEEQLVPGMLVPVRITRGGVAMIVTVRVEAAWSL